MTFNLKKAAMFGLEGESLKKQSGELFLARLQRLTFRLVEGHQTRWLLNSKGAMFGLDARIALAIFGALSVVGGAALFNAIKHTRTISTITQMQEVAKAWEAFYIDTGVNPDKTQLGNTYRYHLGELVEDKGHSGWNGPYTTIAQRSGGTDFLENKDFYIIQGALIKDVDGFGECLSGDKCAAYVLFYKRNGLKLAEEMDKYIDLTSDSKAGRLRYWLSSGNDYGILLRIDHINKLED